MRLGMTGSRWRAPGKVNATGRFHATDPNTMPQPNLPSASARTVRELHPVPAGRPGIRVLIAGVALLALFSVPIFSTVVPPLFDYPNHLARFWILATGGNAFYAVHWAPLPNLAGDLVVPLLARVMPLEFAGKLFQVMIFALIVDGATSLNRVANGGWRLWP